VQSPLWEQPVLRQAAGRTLRPGGFTITDRAANFMNLLPGWRVLDVGCGLGATVGRLRSRYGASAFGVEPSSSQLELVERNTGLIQALGTELPFMDGSFHALFCECVLSLLPSPKSGLKEFHRVLRPNGFLVLSDLYAKDSVQSDDKSCAARAIPLDETRSALHGAGFEILLEEDHSASLKQLAARLLFSAGAESPACSCGRRGLGYYLMIVQKRGSEHAG